MATVTRGLLHPNKILNIHTLKFHLRKRAKLKLKHEYLNPALLYKVSKDFHEEY
jgi:hypothetical protein